MGLNRRNFLQNAALITTASLMRGSLLKAQSSAVASARPREVSELVRVGEVSMADFQRRVGGVFRISLYGVPVGKLTLLSVNQISMPKTEDSGRPRSGKQRVIDPATQPVTFHLLFRQHGSPLPQETYLLEEDWLPPVSLLLVPSSRQSVPATFSATVTQFLPPSAGEDR
jgi:hypothetical protein